MTTPPSEAYNSLSTYQSISVIRSGSDESPMFVAILSNPSPDPDYIFLSQQGQGSTVDEALTCAFASTPYVSGHIQRTLESFDIMSLFTDDPQPVIFKPRKIL